MSASCDWAPAGTPSIHLAESIERVDYFRRSPAAVGGLGRHKEWQHFVILAPQIDLLVNFSCCDDVRAEADVGDESPRIVLLVRDHAWDGDVETFGPEATEISGGGLAARLGGNRLEFRDGVFHIDVTLQTRPISLSLRLVPRTQPAFVPTVTMLDGPPMHWVVVPRLETYGHLTVGDREYRFDGAPAYHDHNWGHFLWGNDVSWEWGFVLADDPNVPWSMTFVRLTDRARTFALMQNLLLWRGEQLIGLFRAEEMTFSTDLAYARPRQVFKIPRVMALVAPEQITDVPRSLTARAQDSQDWICCHCEMEAVAQVLIPSEARVGVTIFNEVAARTHVTGVFADEAIDFTGRSILEFIRA